jgi:hypothetical protein
MKLTKRGKTVVGITAILITTSVFFSSFAIARTLGLYEASVEKPTETQTITDNEIALKGALQSKQVEYLRNKSALSDQELVILLEAVGFKGKALKEAWAIAKRESNGRPIAHNGNTKTGDNSYGVFQINMIGDLGEDRREKFNLVSNADLFDPLVNAKIAYLMSGGGKDWSAWKGLTPRAQAWLSKFPTQ